MVLPGAKADAFRRAAIRAAFLMEREPRKTRVLRLRPAPAIAAPIGAADALQDDPLEAHCARPGEHTSALLAAIVAARPGSALRHVRRGLARQKVLTHRGEEVDHLRIFGKEGFVLDPTGYHCDVLRFDSPLLTANP